MTFRESSVPLPIYALDQHTSGRASDIIRVAVVADGDFCRINMVVVCLADIDALSVRCGYIDAVFEVCTIAHPDGRSMGGHQ